MELNGIHIPIAILQGSTYPKRRPHYLNYGAIGPLIGHEITHAFDIQGIRFDFEGRLLDWWHPEALEEFFQRTKCLVEQNGNYTEPITGMKLNSSMSLGENIADNGGFKIAYLAYRKWEHENGPEKILPGMNFTQHQLFWISAAQAWCSVVEPGVMETVIHTDPHPPSQFRVNGVMSNLKEFANDFQCPEGSPMNPVKKCKVW